ncbi:MAG: oligosaccharide flippase family protein [Vicinamibacterales bacterium]|jgi:O-antigen/teichoic acid export membrane protein|nr:oligosaccharide flippase family protein [Vicinamibacterales bacterium]
MFGNVRRIFGHLIVYGSADVAILAINFLLLPIYTRVLSPAEYGVLALVLVLEAVLKPLYRWGLDTSFLRLYYDCRDDSDRKTLAGTVIVFLLGANGGLTVLLLVAAPVLSELLFGSRDHALTLSLLFANGFIASFIFPPLTRLRIQERSRAYAALTFARSLGTVIVRLVFVVGLRWSVMGIVLADVVVSTLVIAGLGPTISSMTTWRFSRSVAREMLQFGLPRVPQGLMHQGMAMSDRFFLGLYLPLEQVGVYLIGTSIASLVKLYPVAFSTAWMPFAFDSMRRTDAPQLFGRLASYAFAVLGFLTLALACLAQPVVTLMTPASFHAAARVVPLLALGMAIQSTTTFLSTSINVAKRTHAYPIATAVAAAVSIAGYLALIPRWGIFGAATAVVAGQIVLVATLGGFAQRYFAIQYEWLRLGKVVLSAGMLYGIMTALPQTSTALTLGSAVGVLAAYPILLLSLGFFRASELREIRQLMANLRSR